MSLLKLVHLKKEADLPPSVYVLIAAAGSGTRMGLDGNKQFVELLGKPVIVRSCEVFEENFRVTGYFVVARSEEIEAMRECLSKYPLKKLVAVIEGGETRQDSVLQGLRNLGAFLVEQNSASRVLGLVHDGARCLLEQSILDSCIDKILESRCGCGVAVPVSDTIRVLGDKSQVVATPERNQIMAMQTPQGADFPVLLAAYEEARSRQISLTDDLQALEAVGYPIRLVEGSVDNIKLTWQRDIHSAEFILQRRMKEI